MEASQNMYIVLKPQMSIKYVLTQGSSFRLVVNEDMAVQKKKKMTESLVLWTKDDFA